MISIAAILRPSRRELHCVEPVIAIVSPQLQLCATDFKPWKVVEISARRLGNDTDICSVRHGNPQTSIGKESKTRRTGTSQIS